MPQPTPPPPLVRVITAAEAEPLLAEWRWLVPRTLAPLFITRFGDWIFGAPDGSIWSLDMLEGQLRVLAPSGAEYNARKRDPAWLDRELLAGWYDIAVGNGILAGDDECIGWAVAPIVGGKLEKTNLKTYSLGAYQTVMAQLHRRLRGA